MSIANQLLSDLDRWRKSDRPSCVSQRPTKLRGMDKEGRSIVIPLKTETARPPPNRF